MFNPTLHETYDLYNIIVSSFLEKEKVAVVIVFMFISEYL